MRATFVFVVSGSFIRSSRVPLAGIRYPHSRCFHDNIGMVIEFHQELGPTE